MMKPWSPDEEATLRRIYPSEGYAPLVKLLGRTECAITHRAKVLRIRSNRTWKPHEDQRLREAWGKIRTWILAKELKRSPSGIKQRAAKLGLDAARYYTKSDIAMVKKLYPTHTASQIAEKVFGTRRSAKAIHRLTYLLNLRKWPDCRDLYDPIRRLHAEGLVDRLIAKRLKLTHNQVKEIRRNRLKLPTIPDIEGKRQSVRTQMKRLGLSSPTELRTVAFRRFARENGWPEDLRPRAVQILNLLASESRPMTALEIGQRIGVGPRALNSRVILRSNDPEGTYTAHLIKRGLVVRLKRYQTGTKGRGSARQLRSLYMLTAAAIAIIQQRAKEQANESNQPQSEVSRRQRDDDGNHRRRGVRHEIAGRGI